MQLYGDLTGNKQIGETSVSMERDSECNDNNLCSVNILEGTNNGAPEQANEDKNGQDLLDTRERVC